MENFQFIVDWANRDLVSILLGFVSAILTFLIGRWLARVLARLLVRYMERARVEPMVIRFAQTLIFAGIMAAVTIAALGAAGIQTTSLTALLASAGVAIGLAIRDVLSNLASGVMILLFQPYTAHHQVDAAGTSGLVEEVQIFSTVLRTPDNVKVIVPNSAVLRGNISNYSAFDSRRVDLVVTIGIKDDIGAWRDRLMQLMTAHPLVMTAPPPSVDVLDLAQTTVNLAARPWVRTSDYWRARSELLEQIKRLMEEPQAGNEHPSS